MKRYALAIALLLNACGGPEEVTQDGGQVEPTLYPGQEGSRLTGEPTNPGRVGFPFMFNSSPDCQVADCEQVAEHDRRKNSDPLDGPGIIGSSPPGDLVNEESLVENKAAYREYNRIDVKIDWEREP
jgi:hypothetical protein